ncbi:MAG TPA: P-loop NTPase [Nitrospiraceae bacterium]|nr:P-loop NTPase [Nitrospiraceae bacterium]
MARLIAVSINCRNEAARRTFEEIVSRRRDYLVTKGQGTGSVDMLLLELDELRTQQTFAHIRELLSASPDLEVFLTASQTDPQILLEAFRLGVKEFLSQPLTRQEVEPALARFEERFNGRVSRVEKQSGRVVSIIGARGGVGASTVATNLATSVQQASQPGSVVLVDHDMHGGDLGLFLDLHASEGLKHLSKDISRLDETIVRSSVAQHSSGVYLLASGYQGFDEVQLTTGSTMRVIGLLRSMHRHVFVDCGHVLEPAVREALECSDQIIIVMTLSLTTIRRTKRLLQDLGSVQYQAGKVGVIVNRYTNDQKELLNQTEDLLGMRMAGLIPNDYETASEALDHGKPLTTMASRTAIGQWYLRRANQLIGEKTVVNGMSAGKEQSKSASFFGRYLTSFGIEPKGKTPVL